ncbi:MAG: ATP phosphoribosyltransferase regulatory subunit [Leptonema sp. (in: Bacteria)]|nr:ATP phosphoribosyltransferase regulatory subunit [Leptonema sp. (in: bacteria)]
MTSRFSAVPHGIEYLSIEKTERVNRLRKTVAEAFSKAKFVEIIPPMVDYATTFLLTGGKSAEDVFEFKDASGEHLALRSDLTVQILKAAITGRLGQNLPSRYYYLQRVFKDYRPGTGRYREISQAGVEWIGYDKPDRFDILFELACNTLDALNQPYRFLYGDVRFVDSLLSFVNESKRSEITEALYFKDVGRLGQLAVNLGLNQKQKRLLAEAPLLVGSLSTLDKLSDLCSGFPELLKIIEESPKRKELIYDFTSVRQLSYYSGPVIEAYLHQSNRRILSGGFYDQLSKRFHEDETAIPAAGFAIDLNELIHLADNNNDTKD